jgi:hypothetical protein
MSTIVTREVRTPDGQPVAFPFGIRIGSQGGAGLTNNIGVPGQQGFGVGIAPELPTGFAKLHGTEDPASDTYGNYVFTDGSVMVYVPAFYYKYGTGSNGLAINVVDIKPFDAYPGPTQAAAAGYALHRAFYNGGTIRPGVFVDKYLCSNNSGIASSIKLGNPLSSASTNNPFSSLNGAPSNTYAGAIAAAKTRGAAFFCNSLFINKALALLANAHASASTGTAFNAWYDPTGVNNFPKGCNNNALGDQNDPTLAFVPTGFSNANKTGSANFFAKTAHNGQNCGVVDLNGTMWEITPGLTMDSNDHNVGSFYVLKTSTNMATVTGGTTLDTDLWGATGLSALYDNLGVMANFTGYAVNFTDRTLTMGSASQVFSAATSGTPWQMTASGVPLVAGGSNQFGNDGLFDFSTNDMCPLCGGNWSSGAGAGVWALLWGSSRPSSSSVVGFRSAYYL